jgi:N-acetylneuraminic acid mutarotase
VEIAPLKLPRSTGFALVINKKIYIFGGYIRDGKRSKII